MKSVFIFLLILCAYTTFGLKNPGLRARITEKGLNYALKEAVKILSEKIKSFTIPDISGKSQEISYSLNGMHITSFAIPVSSINTSPKVGFDVKVVNAHAVIQGAFQVSVKELIPVHLSGTFDMTISGMLLTLDIGVEKDKSGHPIINSGTCTCHIGSINIIFHGGESFIYNLFKNVVEDEVRNLLEEKMCIVIKSTIKNQADEILMKVPVNVPIDTIFLLDYRLVSPPSFQNNFMDTYHKGEVYFKTDVVEAPFEAPPLPTSNVSSKMFYLWMSDYVFNTLAYSAHKHGALSYNVTKKDLPKADEGFLNTTCLLECIGTVIPQIGQKYPDSSVELHMQSSDIPHITVSDTSVVLSSVFDIEFYVKNPKNGQLIYMMTLATKIVASLDFWVANEKVYAKVIDLPIKVSVKKTDIGPISGVMLNFVVKEAISVFVEPKLNQLGAAGFPLPIIEGIHFQNTELKMEKNTLLIATDVYYGKTNGSDTIRKPKIPRH